MSDVRLFAAAILLVSCATTSATATNCPGRFDSPGSSVTVFCPAPALPDWVLAKADAFLSAATDPPYAKAKYQLIATANQAEHSSSCDQPVVAYALQYRYASLTAVGAEPDAVGVRVPSDPACEGDGQVAAKAADGTIVEPRIARARAIALAVERAGPKASGAETTAYLSLLPAGGTGSPWQWSVTLSSTPAGLKDSEPACWPMYSAIVDAVSGEVLSIEESKTCN